MIELEGVKKAFNQGKSNEFWALRGISLCLPPQAVTVFMGPSGSGKTTLLTLAGCLARPTSGRVRFRDEDISSFPERFLTEIRRRDFGFIFQQFNLIKGLTALENVMLPAYPLGLDYDLLRNRGVELLAMLNLKAKAESKVEWLSGGEAQRVAIARALINDPGVVIADEPTASLDTSLVGQFLEIVALLKSQGKTIIMTSHDNLVKGAQIVDNLVLMRDGLVVP